MDFFVAHLVFSEVGEKTLGSKYVWYFFHSLWLQEIQDEETLGHVGSHFAAKQLTFSMYPL